METFTICLVLALYAFVLKLIGRKLGIIDPIVLVMGGLFLAIVPFIPPLMIDPKLALVIFLPPVLYQASISLSWHEFRHNLRSILTLAVGLVLVTAAAVAGVAYWLVPGMTIASAFVLGAVVSPPDAVAATAVLSKLRVPKRVVTILEGESLINDATALVFYTFAVSAVVSSDTFIIGNALADFLWVSAIGIGIGLVIGKATVLIHKRIEDPQLEVLLSLTIPFIAYIGAEHFHSSGVLAVVAAGLVRGAYSGRVMSAATRLQVLTMWQIIVFTLNAIGFLLIGIELRTVLTALQDSGVSSYDLAVYASAICFTVVAVRFAVLFPAAWLPRVFSPKFRERDPMPSTGTLMVMGWAGMRGIVSLVAVLALPTVTDAYMPFPARDMILFLAYCVLIVTLVGQGSTLGWLARKLKVEAIACPPSHGRNVRAKLRENGLAALRQWSEGKSETAIERLGQHYDHMLARLKAPDSDDRLEILIEQDARDYRELASAALRAERLMLMDMRRKGEIEDGLALELQQELDLHEILIGTERGVG